MANLRPDPKLMGKYLAYSQIGFEMVGPILIGLWLDHAFGWSPVAVIVGAILGLIGGLTHLIHMVRRSQNNDSSQSRKSSQ